MADSLEGNFLLDSDSDHETSTPIAGPSRPAAAGNKRPRRSSPDDDDNNDDESLAAKAAAGASSDAKKAKRKQREKARKARRAELRKEEEETRQNPAHLPPEFQADWLRRELRACKGWKELSEMEMDEVGVSKERLIDSTSWQGGREVGDLAGFLMKLLPDLESSLNDASSPLRGTKGAPAVLVITNNALRAVDLARGLRGLLSDKDQASSAAAEKRDAKKSKKVKITKDEKTESEDKNEDQHADSTTVPSPPSLQIAKLFARHFSVSQQTDFLSSHHIAAGAGTAQRVATLLSRGAIKLDNLQALVIDAGWRDEKMRGMMDEEGGREGMKEAWSVVRGKEGVKVLLF